MNESLTHILVFKTNIKTDIDRLSVKTLLDNHACIEKWNIDQQDVDCVLRIVSPTLTVQETIDLITGHGYECCELV